MSIRLRLALTFAAAAAAAFAVGGWLFAAALSAAQLRVIDSQLTAQLAQAARYLPGTGAVVPTAGSPPPGEYVVQVVDSAGRVVGASPEGGEPLLTAAELNGARNAQMWATQAVDEERTRVTAAPLAGHPGWVAVAGVSLEAYDTTQSQVTRGLAIGGTAFVAIAGLGAYWLARAALSPVERLRRQVAAISGRGDVSAVMVPATRDEIAALAGTMNELLDRLRGALERERAFVADASHELRSPLAVLRGELELAARPGRDPGELTAAVRLAAEEAERLSRITDDLLLLARGDSGHLDLRLADTDLRELVGRSLGLAAARLAAADVTGRADVPPGTRARVDPDRIRQAIDNLLDNALRFAPPGSVIVVAAAEEGPDVRIDVSDDGPGFPDGFLPHAFERFRRPDTGRSRGGGGAGLGLAIVAAIAVAHGGRAIAANKPGGGAVVSLWLPGASRLFIRTGPWRLRSASRDGDDDRTSREATQPRSLGTTVRIECRYNCKQRISKHSSGASAIYRSNHRTLTSDAASSARHVVGRGIRSRSPLPARSDSRTACAGDSVPWPLPGSSVPARRVAVRQLIPHARRPWSGASLGRTPEPEPWGDRHRACAPRAVLS